MTMAARVKQLPLLLKIIGLILGISLLVIGQAWASVIHWLRLPPNSFDSLSATTCSIVPFCGQVGYPFYFFLIFPLLLLAMILLALAMRHTALRVMRDVEWTTLVPVLQAGRWRIRSWALAVVSLVASILGVISTFSSDDQYPNPLIWFVALLLWGATFYSFDRTYQRRMPLTRREVINLFAYLLLLVALGFVYHLPMLQTPLPRASFVLIAALILLALWYAKGISGVAAVFALIAVAGLAVYTYNLMSWRYSYIPDAYPFYDAATHILHDPNLPNLLNSRGVYDLNPVFANYTHAAGLTIYGSDFYGWRYIDIVLIFLTAPAIYGLVRQLKSTGTALVAVIVFIGTHHLIALAHVGYNNLEVLPGFAAMLVFALLALERRSTLAMFLSAVGASATFYTYGLAFPLIPIPLLMLAIWALWPTHELPLARRLRRAFLLGIVFLIGVWATAFPRALNTVWISDAAFKSVLRSEMHGLTSPLLQQIIPNTVYALGASIYFDQNSHYMSGAHLDPVSSALMLIGVAGLIAVAMRRRTALWLLLCFLVTTFVDGGLVPYAYPANTRTFLLEVFYAVFAALGAGYLWETAQDVGVRLSRGILCTGFALSAIAILALNAYQFLYLSPLDVPEFPLALIMEQLQDTQPGVTLYFVDANFQDDPGAAIAAAIGLDANRLQHISDDIPIDALMQVRQTATAPYRVIIVPDYMPNPQAWYDAAQQVWPDHPLTQISDTSGMPQFQMIDVPR